MVSAHIIEGNYPNQWCGRWQGKSPHPAAGSFLEDFMVYLTLLHGLYIYCTSLEFRGFRQRVKGIDREGIHRYIV